MRPLLLIAAALCGLAAMPVAAQQERVARVDPQTAISRVCASEIGLTGEHEECAAIHAVLRGRAERAGISLVSMARAYSSRVFELDRTDARRWVAHLDARGREPLGWPDVASWSHHRPRWLALHDAAGAILRGEIEHGCEGDLDHWGMSLEGSIDMRRAERAGWTRVVCPESYRNAYWRVERGGEG